MYTLGINAAFHDSAACLVKDGQLIAAAEEERFTRIKHAKRPIPFSAYELPFHAINYCLEQAGIRLSDVDHIAYSFNEQLLAGKTTDDERLSFPPESSGCSHYGKWDSLFFTYMHNASRYLVEGYPHHLQQRFEGCSTNDFTWHPVDHHISHAASAYLPSPFEEAAIMVVDGRGEYITTSYYKGMRGNMEGISHVDMPHSLGLLYEWVTRYLGFLHSSDEYKVMALASYGEPVYYDYFDRCIQTGSNGHYEISMPDLEADFGPARKREEQLTMFHFNLAHSLQKVMEQKVLELARWLHTASGLDNLCMAGGVMLNCVLNSVLRDRTNFKNIWVQPAAGDAGTALGAALWVDANIERARRQRFSMEHVFWGPEYDDGEVLQLLKSLKLRFRKMDNIARETAALLAEGKIVGWFQGRMEFGPRSLGARSILASPTHASMQTRLNKLKEREDFRPVAPVVLEEAASEWFENGGASPFMLFVDKVKRNKINAIPAVTHVDGTARVQTINRSQHALYYDLLKAFDDITGVPILVNTSFNTKGEPIVCSPRDAIACFYTSPFDVLVLNSYLLDKEEDAGDMMHQATSRAVAAMED